MKTPRKPVAPERKKELEESRQRMKEIIADMKRNPSKLERYLGLTNGIITNVLTLRNVISHNFAKALTDKHPEYYYDWVMSGTPPKKKTGEIPVKIESNEIQTSECKRCIEKERIITALDRIIKLLEEDNEKLKKKLANGTIQETIPDQETG